MLLDLAAFVHLHGVGLLVRDGMMRLGHAGSAGYGLPASLLAAVHERGSPASQIGIGNVPKQLQVIQQMHAAPQELVRDAGGLGYVRQLFGAPCSSAF